VRRVLALLAVALLALAGCGSGSAGDRADQLTVLAASSLTETFPEIGQAFEEAHPGASVRLSFAGSQELVAQADGGAPADVLALAGTGSLEALSTGTGDPVVFAHNQLTIIVPPGNPAGIHGLADLADPDVKVALAGPEVPAGAYAREMFDDAGLTVTPVSEEVDVKSVVTRVSVGGADAGVVYVTDADAAGDQVELVPIPDRWNVVATYPAVTLDASGDAALAAQFVQFLLGDQAQQILLDHGFTGP
jgi:molybdate transport system substrate-binding protein